MEVDLPVRASVLSPTNILQTTSTDVYTDSDDSYDIILDNIYDMSRGGTCRCVFCIEHEEKRKDRKRKRREEKRRKKTKKQGKKIKINGFSAS